MVSVVGRQVGGQFTVELDIEPRLFLFRPASIGWCPDSTCLLVTDATGPGKPDAIFVVPLETGATRQLTHPEGVVSDMNPAVSPDGRSLVFRRDTTPFGGEFFRLSMGAGMESEGPAVRLTPTTYGATRNDSLASLAPDGRRVVFLSDRSGEFEFWVSELDGSNAVQLTPMAILPGFAKWSADGALIAFHGDPAGRPDVRVGPAGGDEPSVITAGTDGGGFPSFSRDGQWIYFAAGLQKVKSTIWKMPVAGGTLV